MGFFIGAGGYYEGDRKSADDLEVPRRPAAGYDWNGAAWIVGNGVIVNQIAAVEAAQPLTQRAIRELMLAIGQAFPAAQSSLFYQKAAAQEAQVAVLRLQIK